MAVQTIALSPVTSSLYLAETGGSVVRRVDLATGIITRVAGNGSAIGPHPDEDIPALKATIADKDGGATEYTASVPVANVAPSVTIATPSSGSGFAVGTPVSFAAPFTDPGVHDTHTATWSFDALTAPGLVTELGGSGTATATYAFTAPGVYTVAVAVTDNAGGVGRATSLVAVFDPRGGFVTGGGWQGSPNGKAHFNITSIYKGTSVTGKLDFRNDALSFAADSLSWLVVAGHAAELRGTGTLNATHGYQFEAFAVQGSPDRFRIKIWDGTTGAVAFDTVPGAPDDLDLASPAPLDGGNVTVH